MLSSFTGARRREIDVMLSPDRAAAEASALVARGCGSCAGGEPALTIAVSGWVGGSKRADGWGRAALWGIQDETRIYAASDPLISTFGGEE